MKLGNTYFCYFLSTGRQGGIRTLDLMIGTLVFDHSATEALPKLPLLNIKVLVCVVLKYLMSIKLFELKPQQDYVFNGFYFNRF
jgi:hypothetical protein